MTEAFTTTCPGWLPLTEVSAAAANATRPFARRGTTTLTHADFIAGVQAWHARLATEPGQRWALYTDDSASFAAMLFGAWHAGKTVLLPGDMQPATLRRLAGEVDGCLGDLPGALPEPVPPTAPLPREPLDLKSTQMVVYTSGSGGEPVAIAKSLAQLDAEMRALQQAFGERVDAQGPATVVATVSHQHIYGLLFQVLWSLAAGRPFVAQRLEFLEALPAQLGDGPGLLVASPAHLRRVPEAPGLPGALGGLKAVFSSGGPLPPEGAADSLARLGHSPIEVFGSSETGGIAWRQRALHGDHWRELPGVAWRLDEQLLSVRSAHLPDDDWYLTNDLVRALPDGGFVLIGRADRIVKVGEKRVSLSAIERVLLAGPELAEARALLLSDPADPDGGAALGRIAVVAVPRTEGYALLQTAGRHGLAERLRARLVEHVERVALPRRWRFVPALPVNPQGKSTEAQLTAEFEPPSHGRPLHQWLLMEPTQARLSLTPQADLAVFDGHFPEQPILPGVAQLDWAALYGREAFAITGRFVRVDSLKFRQTIAPGTALELSLNWSADKGTLGFQWRSQAGEHTSGKLVFEEPGDAH